MLDFSLFGGVRVSTLAKELHLGRKQQQLLGLLMLYPNATLAPDVLVDFLWGEKLPANPLNSLQDLVKRLRAALGDSKHEVIVTRRGEYGLQVDPDRIDVEIFRRLARAGLMLELVEPAAARLFLIRALENAGGDLPDLAPDLRASEKVDSLYDLKSAALDALGRLAAADPPDEGTPGEFFSAWSLEGRPVGLALRVPELRELALADILGTVARHAGRVHRLSGGRLLASFPGGSSALRAVLALAARSGPEGDGLLSGAVCHVDIGSVQAAERLLELAERASEGQFLVTESVRRSAATAAAKSVLTPVDGGIWQVGGRSAPISGPSVTPPEVPMVGRQEAVAEIARLIRIHPLVTLRGPGGIGKTRLARALQELFATRLPDGAALVDLAEADRHPDPVAVVVRSLGFVPQPYQRPEDTLVDRLQAQERLIVLDNCEELIDLARRLSATLVERCPGVRLLATSRIALGVPGEYVFDLFELNVDDAAGLLARLAAPPGAGPLEPTEDLVKLCLQLDCVPLAIECAAPMVRAMGLEAAVQALYELPDGTLLPLLDAAHGGRGRHRSIELALNASHRLLTPADAHFFERLCCLVGGFSTRDAGVAAAGAGFHEVGRALARLREASLIKQVGPDRWRMLEPVRQFAATRLLRRGEQAEQSARHARHFAALALEAGAQLRGPEASEWCDRVDAAYPNLVKALWWLESGRDAEAALALTSSLWWYWAARGMFVEGSEAVERALAIPAAAPPLVRAGALVAASHLAWWAGNPFRTHTSLVEAMSLLGDGDDLPHITLRAWAHTGLAAARMWGGDKYELLKQHLETGARLARQAGDLVGLGLNYSAHSGIAWHAGDDRGHLAMARQALEVFEQAHHMPMVAHSRRVIGLAKAGLGDVDEGRPLIRDGLQLSEKLGDLGGMPLGLGFLGLLEVWAGDRRAAAPAFERSISINIELGQVWPTLIALAIGSEQAGLDGRLEDCIRLNAVVEGLTAKTGIRLSPHDRGRVARVVERATRRAGAEAAAAARREGEALLLPDALRLAGGVFGTAAG